MKTTQTTNAHVLAAQAKAAEMIRLAQEAADKLIEETEANISLLDAIDTLQAKRQNLSDQIRELDAQLRNLGAKAPKIQMSLVDVPKPESTVVNTGVGQLAYKLMASGMSNKGVLSAIEKHYGNTKTKMSSVAWYRNKYNHGASAAE